MDLMHLMFIIRLKNFIAITYYRFIYYGICRRNENILQSFTKICALTPAASLRVRSANNENNSAREAIRYYKTH